MNCFTRRLGHWIAYSFISIRWMSKKKKPIRIQKGPVEPSSNAPNSVFALMADRTIPPEMSLREVWDRLTDPVQRKLEKLQVTRIP